MLKSIKFIHTADLHLGVDFSTKKWRMGIKQRADDFYENFLEIVRRSKEVDIDFVILAGDIYDRSKPNPIITQMVLKELIILSNYKPVFVVPGNHDKSKLSKGLLFLNKNFYIFNKPETLILSIKGVRIGITGIPFIRNNKLPTIEKIINNSSYNQNIDVRILIMHELVESSIVGIQNYQFTKQMNDVIPLDMIDNKFDYVALGHVHKFQKIQKILSPIYYSGSIERTSVVEREETKGYIITEVNFNNKRILIDVNPVFNELLARPMVYQKIPFLTDAYRSKIMNIVKQNIRTDQKSPLVYIRIQSFNNYKLYLSLKSELKALKEKSLIFEFRITSPEFRKKINTLFVQKRSAKSISKSNFYVLN
ncbi:MAG: metallophosphoesterase family protein [Candidatus Hodarchaeales archaeon]